LGAVVTKAAANDRQQAGHVFRAMVIRPPPPDVGVVQAAPRDLPSAKADGVYGNGQTRQRTNEAGFPMRAPKRG
jgi:hypothetical protein